MKEETRVHILVLAAGKGSRMRSETSSEAKVLRKLRGKSLLAHVLASLPLEDARQLGLIIGYQGELVLAEAQQILFEQGLVANDLSFFWQYEQKGTGHAVLQAVEWLKKLVENKVLDVLIAYGDMPMVKPSTYKKLLQQHQQGGYASTILTFNSPILKPFGRILRDANGAFLGIVEDKDATATQRLIREMNTGIYVFRIATLIEALTSLTTNNVQGEYYLTDVPLYLKKCGLSVGLLLADDANEGLGVNTLEDLLYLEKVLSK